MGGKGSGRKKKTAEKELEHRTIQQVISTAAIDAINYLAAVAKGGRKEEGGERAYWARIDVCKFIVEHEIGKPKQKTELTGAGGAPLTWAALILLAGQAEEEGELPKFAGVALIPKEATKPPEGAEGE